MKFETLNDWLDWQEKLHVQPIDLGLDRIRPVFENLLSQGLTCTSIIVGGTNGKGSTSAFLESIYVAAGYKVGVYSSPHLQKYNERVRLDGELVSDTQLCHAFERVDQARGETSLTYFEFGTLAAFDIFQQAQVDVAILEVGLGGRLDAVNLVDADVAIVTNVDLDHVAWLGDTREKIAFEKFGITRRDKPLIFADDNPPTNTETLVRDIGCQFKLIGKDFGFLKEQESWQWWSTDKKWFSLPFPALHGFHQFKNASSALMAVNLLTQSLPVSMAHIRTGLSKAVLPGRFQVIQQDSNLIIFDVAHNPHGVNAFVQQISQMPKLGDIHLVLAMLEDKNVENVIEILQPVVDHWYLAGLDVPRGLSSECLSKRAGNMLSKAEASVTICDNVPQAFETAKRQLANNDKLLVIGSFYTVAQALEAS